MIRLLTCSGCLALSMLLSVADSASAREADEVFARCNHRLIELTRTCHKHIETTVKRCVPEIRELLHQGRVEAAHRLARTCIANIRQQTERCDNAIERLCRRCVRKLISLEAPKLAERFRNRCGKSKRSIHFASSRAIKAIESLFNDRD